MKKWLCSVAGLSLALAGSLAAQAQTPPVPPPNILNIETNNIKPYQDGPYDKVASQYPALSQQLKDPTHFVVMQALTGSPRAIYLYGYDSYEALQKNEEWELGNAAIDAKFDALDTRQAPNVSEIRYTIWHYRSDLSNNVAGADIPHSHYWEVIIFHMKPGHSESFGALTKIYRDAYLKSGQNIPWSSYEGMMGVTDAYLVLVPMKSLGDEDAGLAHQKDFGAALGDEGKSRMNKLTEENVASVEDNLFMVDPDWSYVDKPWVDADPQYWGGGPTTKPAHKPAAAAPAPKASPTH